MEMYEAYILEREGLSVIKTDKGFITWRIDFPDCTIGDYFVMKEYRQSGHGYFLANQVFEICKNAGVRDVFCYTDDRAKNEALSKFTIENFGFEFIDKKGHSSEYKLGVKEWDVFSKEKTPVHKIK